MNNESWSLMLQFGTLIATMIFGILTVTVAIMALLNKKK